MFNLVLLAARPPDWSHEQFIEWWRGEHAEMTYPLPGLRAWRHTAVSSALEPRSEGWDGLSVLSFDSEEAARVTRESAAIVAVDAEGRHTLEAMMRAGDDLAGALEKVVGREPTVLFQADNTWRTVAATIAVGRLGGTLALISRHATREECAAALDDIRPDAVIASGERMREWSVGDRLPALDGEILDGWACAGEPGAPAVPWGGGVVFGLTSGSTGRAKGVVQSEAALRYAPRR